MKYTEGFYLKEFINSLPIYVSDLDRKRIIYDSVNILSEIDSQSHVQKMMLVGQVQSGKTNVICGLTTLAVDNDYNLVIIFGGVNQLLLSQTFDRIKKPFHTVGYDDLLIIDKDKLKTDQDIDSYSKICSKNKTRLIIITMKESQNIRNLIYFLENIYISKLKVLVIDDEADNASINIGKKGTSSKVFDQLSKIYSMIKIGGYIGVTATPYGNLVSKKSKILYPDKIYNLIPSKEYTGLDFFNNIKDTAYFIVDNIKQDLHWERTIYVGLAAFFVNSFVMHKQSSKSISHELLINIDLKIDSFVDIKLSVNRFLKKILSRIGNKRAFYDINEISDLVESLVNNGIWTQEYETDFLEYLRNELIDISERIYILADEDNFYESKNNGLSIVIGGSLVSRGFTFNNLLVEVMLNSPETDIPADTLLQRARWFGYRRNLDRYKYMKIFISQNIFDSYCQFVELQDNLLKYINLVRLGKINLNYNTANEFLGEFETIVPSRKK